MPGFNQTALANKVQNTNNVVILVGDQVIGFGQSSSFGVDFGTEGIYGIGNAKPQEVQSLKTSITVTLDMFLLTAQGLAYLGQPSDISDVLSNNQFSIAALDGQGNPIKTAIGCTATSLNISMPANQMITEAISFIAMDILGPTGLSILNGNAALTLTSVTLGATTNLTTPGGF